MIWRAPSTTSKRKRPIFALTVSVGGTYHNRLLQQRHLSYQVSEALTMRLATDLIPAVTRRQLRLLDHLTNLRRWTGEPTAPMRCDAMRAGAVRPPRCRTGAGCPSPATNSACMAICYAARGNQKSRAARGPWWP